MSPHESVLRRLGAEPLTHFLLLGIGLFALHRAVAPVSADAADTVVVAEETEAWLVAQFEQGQGRAPSDRERTELIARHVDEEVLYREGIALGLDRSDPIVRRRVVQRMQLLLEDLEQPDEQQVQAFFEQHAADYRGPEMLDLEHVYFGGDGGEGEAASALRALAAGEDPGAFGQPFVHGNTLRHRSAEQLSKLLGAEFAEAAARAPVGEWTVVRSALGWHVVRVAARDVGAKPELGQVRARVAQDWRRARSNRGASVARALTLLRARYRVDREASR